MTAALIAVSAVAVIAVAGLAFVALRSSLAAGPSLADRTVVIHTRRPDDQSVRGVLVAQHTDRFTLREVVYLHGSGDQAVGGLVHVPIENIAWVQEITGQMQGE